MAWSRRTDEVSCRRLDGCPTPRDTAGVGNETLLVLVVVTALAFDFTNGFHDTGNAMATSIATGALGPRTAVEASAGDFVSSSAPRHLPSMSDRRRSPAGTSRRDNNCPPEKPPLPPHSDICRRGPLVHPASSPLEIRHA